MKLLYELSFLSLSLCLSFFQASEKRMILKGPGGGQRPGRVWALQPGCPARQLEGARSSWEPRQESVRTQQHPLWFLKHPLICSLCQKEGKMGVNLPFGKGRNQAPKRGSNSPKAPEQEPTYYSPRPPGFPHGPPSVSPQSLTIPPPQHTPLCILVVGSLPSLIRIDMGSWAWTMQTHLSVPFPAQSGKGDP